MEGVMIRGRRYFSLAVRRLNGQVYSVSEPLSQLYVGRLRRVPLLRGLLILLETLVLGVKALNRSAMIAIEDQTGNAEEVPKWVTAIALIVAFILGIGLFFIMPIFALRPIEDSLSSEVLANLIEGIIRLVMLVVYIGLIGLINDIKRVFRLPWC